MRQEVLGKLQKRYQGAGAEHRSKLIDQAVGCDATGVDPSLRDA